MFQVGGIRVLYETADVAIGISQVFGERIGSKYVEPVREALVQRGLKSIVERLKLGIVQRQYLGHIRLLREVAPSEIRYAIRGIRSTKVRIENLRRLVEIAGLVVPEIVGASSHVCDLSHPIGRELVLHAKVPLQNARNNALRPR